MSDRIDPPVQLMQPPTPQPAPNFVPTQPQPKQLPPRNHPMLSLRQARNFSAETVSPLQGVHTTPKCGLTDFRPRPGLY